MLNPKPLGLALPVACDAERIFENHLKSQQQAYQQALSITRADREGVSLKCVAKGPNAASPASGVVDAPTRPPPCIRITACKSPARV
jgi:hypothetical protein